MGCPKTVNLGDPLPFSLYTHDPDIGVITAAESAPSYWVTDEDDTAIENGTMDAGARTGSYKKKLSITSAAGYALGKTYTIYISMTVDGDQGGVTYDFRVRKPSTAVTRSRPPPSSYNSWFVATDGDPGNDGSVGSPWDIDSALLNTTDVQPGDTIYLRAGTYYHTDRSVDAKGYPVALVGANGAQVVVRPYPGERVIIDGGIHSEVSYVPQYVTIRDLEVIVSENLTETRTSSYSGSSAPPDLVRPWGGIDIVYGTSIKLVNNIIHHNTGNGCGFWGPVSGNSEFYGNIVYENGWIGADRRHGHGFYSQNPDSPPSHSDWKYVQANIFLDHFYYACQIYGSSITRAERYLVEDNIFNGGYTDYGGTTDGIGILLGGEGYNDQLYFNHNFGKGNCELSAQGTYNGVAGAVNNIIWSGLDFTSGGTWDDLSASNNWTWFYLWLPGPPRLDGVDQPIPTAQFTRFQLNTYDSNRAYIAVMDFPADGETTMDFSDLLDSGDTWELRDPEDFFGDPIQSGTYTGASVTFPVTSGGFTAYVLVKTG